VQLSPIDRLGRAIDPVVFRAAERLAPRVSAYGERLVADPAVVVNLLEESAVTVSRVWHNRQHGESPIRHLEAYLFRTFVRKLHRALRRNTTTCNYHVSLSVDFRRDLERKLLIEELLRTCDPITQEMFYRRIQGFSWRDIGRIYGISAHAAESRFGQALQRVRKKICHRSITKHRSH
jgi:DNA-directed RNA polymerase specialized sigma24 family protein